MASEPRTKKQLEQIKKLRQDLRQMFQLQKSKPEMTALMMGEERENVSWEEAEDDLSLGIATYVVLDLFAAHDLAKKNELLGLIGIDAQEVRGSAQNPNNPAHHTKATKTINAERARLRTAIDKIYPNGEQQ